MKDEELGFVEPFSDAELAELDKWARENHGISWEALGQWQSGPYIPWNDSYSEEDTTKS